MTIDTEERETINSVNNGDEYVSIFDYDSESNVVIPSETDGTLFEEAKTSTIPFRAGTTGAPPSGVYKDKNDTITKEKEKHDWGILEYEGQEEASPSTAAPRREFNRCQLALLRCCDPGQTTSLPFKGKWFSIG